jgi:DNA recombination protein RmuC
MIDFLYVLVGAILGGVAGYLLGANKAKNNQDSTDVSQLRVDLASAQALATERQNRINDLQRDLDQRVAKHNEENELLLKLSPVAESLKAMQEKVASLEDQRAKELNQLLGSLAAQVNATNQLRGQTNALAKAMTNTSDRGRWGEIQLERVVEAAGMMNRVDFVTQTQTTDGDNGPKRPDLVVQLPGNRSIPIDSKVPFDAYLEAMNFDDLTNPEHIASRKRLLDKHVSDLRGHIKTLGAKKYWAGYANAADYVVAFIPSENLLGAALEHDPTLVEYAMSNNVVLSTPQTLFAMMKAIALIWQNTTDQIALNDVINLGKDLFARLKVVAGHAATVGRGIQTAANSYNDFVASMERNLLTTARQLNAKESVQFGVVEIPELKQVASNIVDFTKPELAQPEIGPAEFGQQTHSNEATDPQ